MKRLFVSTPLRMVLAALAAVPVSFALHGGFAVIFLSALEPPWTIQQSGDTKAVGAYLFDLEHVAAHTLAKESEPAKLTFVVKDVFGRFVYIDECGGENAGEALLTVSVHHKADDPDRFGPSIVLQQVLRQPEDGGCPVVSQRLGFISEDRTINLGTGADGCGLDIRPLETDALPELMP